MPDTHTTPSRRYQVRADHILTWLANATDSIGQPFHETYGLNDTFRPGVDDLHDRIQVLVSQAHTDGVLTVPGHHLELWQVADEGFLLTLDQPHGPRLCSPHLSIRDLMPDKTAGSVAVFAVLDATARVANQLLDERDHALHAHLPGRRRVAGVASVPLGPPPNAVTPVPPGAARPRHR